MNTYMQRIGIAVASVVAVVSFWACEATRQSDGSLTIRFAPDMAITAWGLEDALGKLIDLQAACSNGTFPRPCTDAERNDILKAIEKVLRRKAAARPSDSLGGA